MIIDNDNEKVKNKIIDIMITYLLIGFFITIIFDIISSKTTWSYIYPSENRCPMDRKNVLWCDSMPNYYMNKLSKLRFWTDVLSWPVWFVEIFRNVQ